MQRECQVAVVAINVEIIVDTTKWIDNKIEHLHKAGGINKKMILNQDLDINNWLS